jgi:predicted alpha-1,6-mannanase (GH76 family)
MLLQCEHTILSWKDLSVQIAGWVLFIAVARNEAMPAQGRF